MRKNFIAHSDTLDLSELESMRDDMIEEAVEMIEEEGGDVDADLDALESFINDDENDALIGRVDAECEYLIGDAREVQEFIDALGADETAIHEGNFAEYAKTFAEDVRGIDVDEWPFAHINWDEAAEGLKMDFQSHTFDGVEYYFR